MRVLLTDETETCRDIGDRLAEHGHEVIEACLPDHVTGVCQGIVDHRCPLDSGADLAVTALDRHQDVASAGVVCATRAGVPVATLGSADADHADLEPSLRRIAASGDPALVGEVDAALQRELAARGLPVRHVRVVRDADSEVLIATVPGAAALSSAERSRIAVSLLTAATASGRRPLRRDVSVRDEPPYEARA